VPFLGFNGSVNSFAVFYIHSQKSAIPIPEADPTIVSYNASAVKKYNATSSLMSLTTKNIFSYIQRKTLKPTTYNAGVTVVLNSEDIGLAPGGV
jgi:hypothetical protein